VSGEDTRLSAGREVSLVDILDRVIGCGVVVTGDVSISLADVDLVYLDLRLLLGSVGTILRGGAVDAGGSWADHAEEGERR
jgi:hypothetical protein